LRGGGEALSDALDTLLGRKPNSRRVRVKKSAQHGRTKGMEENREQE
jgi:hypothetical protein